VPAAPYARTKGTIVALTPPQTPRKPRVARTSDESHRIRAHREPAGVASALLSGFGLKELISKQDVTIVKNPGTAQMEIITKENGQIKTLKQTPQQAQGAGKAVGTVFELSDGRMVRVPGASQATPTPAP